MSNDVYFDCTVCGHTILTDSDLVGKLVDCPDCGGEVRVPDIREGLNPRLRKPRRSKPVAVSIPVSSRIQDLERLTVDLVALLQRQQQQSQLLDGMQTDCQALVQRLNRRPPSVTRVAAPLPDPILPDPAVQMLDAKRWLKWSLGFAVLTLLALGGGSLLLMWRS